MGCSGVAAGTGSRFPLFPRGLQRVYSDVDTERNTAQLLVGGAGDHRVFGQHKNISQVLLEPGAFDDAVQAAVAQSAYDFFGQLTNIQDAQTLRDVSFRLAGKRGASPS